MFDRAFLQMIEYLIADNARFAGNLLSLFKIRHVEIAQAIGEYFALLAERVESRKRVLQRMRSAPVQQVAIQPISLEVSERSLASDLCAQSGGILWQHLGDQEHLIAPAPYNSAVSMWSIQRSMPSRKAAITEAGSPSSMYQVPGR